MSIGRRAGIDTKGGVAVVKSVVCRAHVQSKVQTSTSQKHAHESAMATLALVLLAASLQLTMAQQLVNWAQLSGPDLNDVEHGGFIEAGINLLEQPANTPEYVDEPVPLAEIEALQARLAALLAVPSGVWQETERRTWPPAPNGLHIRRLVPFPR